MNRLPYIAYFVFFIVLITKRKDEAQKLNNRSRNLFAAVFFAYILWLISSCIWSAAQDLTFNMISYYFQYNIITVLLVLALVHDDDQLAALMNAYVLGSFISVIGTIISFKLGIAFGGLTSHRYASLGYNPNDLGLTLALAIPMALYLANTRIKSPLRWLYFLYLPTSFIAILLTASRGAFLSTMVALTYIPLTFSRTKIFPKIMLMFALLAISYAVFYFVPKAPLARISTMSNELYWGSLSGRTYIWETAWGIFRDNPLIGIGSGAFKEKSSSILGSEQVSHNAFLSALVELGIVGFILFAGIIAAILSRIKILPPVQMRLWLVLILTWVVGASFMSWDYYRQTWVLFAMAAAQISIYEGKTD
ncbi:MAG: O-antigen ligase family protein [Candidatus Margulisiibacteriota bacterium]